MNRKSCRFVKTSPSFQETRHYQRQSLRALFLLWCFPFCLFWAQGADPSRFNLTDISFEHLTKRDGLPQNGVLDMLQDSKGFIWLATRDGLARYDGQRFTIYQRSFSDASTIPGNQIGTIAEDQDGLIWLGTSDSGLASVNPVTGKVRRYLACMDISDISDIHVDASNQVWVTTDQGISRFNREADAFECMPAIPDGDIDIRNEPRVMTTHNGRLFLGTDQGLCEIDPVTGRSDFVTDHEGVDFADDIVTSLGSGCQGLWFTTYYGLYLFNADTGVFREFEIELGEGQRFLESEVLEDHKGAVWLTSNQGLVLLDPETGAYEKHQYRPSDPRSLGDNMVQSIMEDRSGIVWVGTFTAGVSKYNRMSDIVKILKRDPSRPKNDEFNSIFGVLEDSEDQLWFGGDDGGISRYNRRTGEMVHYLQGSVDDGKISLSTAYAIAQQTPGEIWVGGWLGLNHLNIATGKVTAHAYRPGDDAFVYHSFLLDMRFDEDGYLWAASYGGLVRINVATAPLEWTFIEPKPEAGIAVTTARANAIDIDKDGVIWLGLSGDGVLSYDPRSEQFTHFQSKRDDPKTLAQGYVLDIMVDQKNRVWVGTLGGGLNLLNRDGVVQRITRDNGLGNEKIFSLIEDANGEIWCGTNQGLARYNPETGAIKNLDVSYNLQGNEYDRGAALLCRDGTLVFGGIDGINIFHPRDIQDSLFDPTVLLTGVSVLNKPLRLSRELSAMDALQLDYHDRAIVFQFAALDYHMPDKNRYAYSMKGLTESWVELGNRGEVTFPKLAPGHYELRVKGSNHEGHWSEHEAALKIVVPAPWWQTKTAYSLYVIALLGLVFALVSRQRQKYRREREINEQLRQVDRLKDEFLANTSHELRTPLHGMIGLAESLMAGAAGKPTEGMVQNLDLIVASGRRLESLVNDILDFSKIRQERLELAQIPVDLSTLCDVVFSLCKPLANEKNLLLKKTIPTNFPLVLADEARLQQIFYNLLGNAIKFTEEGGVQVTAAVKADMAHITIVDTGIGFDDSNAMILFESFQQGDGSIARQFGGTGLGLAITRELVKRHGGEIWAQAKPGKGAHFSFSLPLAQDSDAIEAPAIDLPDVGTATISAEPETVFSVSAAKPEEGGDGGRRFCILAVDDEPANRQILGNVLGLQNYEVHMACDGPQALEKVSERDFDLILLDIMMPRMSGFEVLRRIRQNYSLQELPVIFLTAKAQVSDLVTGFDLGANDYLTKPFSKDSLLSRVKPHLQLKEIYSDLEQKVAERTNALRQHAEELETIDAIVRTINRELLPMNMLETILMQGKSLFSEARCGAIFLKNPLDRYFQIVVRGACFATVQRSYLAEEIRRNLGPHNQLGPHIYVQPASVLLHEGDDGYHEWIVIIEFIESGRLEGTLLLLCRSDPQSFPQMELRRLTRYREHAVSAISRVRMLQELDARQRDLVQSAHFIGMAENARMVLHNMGNSLNSINTSCEVLDQSLDPERWLGLAQKLGMRFGEVFADLSQQTSADQRLPETLNEFFERMKRRDLALRRELERLQTHVSKTLLVLRDQNEYSEAQEMASKVDVNSLISACILAGGRSETDVSIQFEPVEVPPVWLPKIRFMHLLTSLVRYAIVESKVGSDGLVSLSCNAVDDELVLEIRDNGAGVSNEALTSIFSQDNAADGGHHSSQLHHCANLVKEMGGSIELHSEGRGKGETIRLKIPMLTGEVLYENT